MKRILISLLIIIFTLTCLAGCLPSTPTGEESEIFKVLSECNTGSRGFDLSITTNHSKLDNLNSFYSVTYTENGYNVNYSYELLNKINLEDPDGGYKLYKRGSAIVVNGAVKSYTGDEIDILPPAPELNFKEENFFAVEYSDSSFSATVTNPSDFLGFSVPASELLVSLSYSGSSITSVTVTYSASDDSNVIMTYTFR